MTNVNPALDGWLRLARCVVEDGWPLLRASDQFNVSVTTTARWSRRYREQGASAMGGSFLPGHEGAAPDNAAVGAADRGGCGWHAGGAQTASPITWACIPLPCTGC